MSRNFDIIFSIKSATKFDEKYEKIQLTIVISIRENSRGKNIGSIQKEYSFTKLNEVNGKQVLSFHIRHFC